MLNMNLAVIEITQIRYQNCELSLLDELGQYAQ